MFPMNYEIFLDINILLLIINWHMVPQVLRNCSSELGYANYSSALLSILHRHLLPPNLVPSHQGSITRPFWHYESSHASRRCHYGYDIRDPHHIDRLLCAIHDNVDNSDLNRYGSPFYIEDKFGLPDMDWL